MTLWLALALAVTPTFAPTLAPAFAHTLLHLPKPCLSAEDGHLSCVSPVPLRRYAEVLASGTLLKEGFLMKRPSRQGVSPPLSSCKSPAQLRQRCTGLLTHVKCAA